MTAPDRRFEPRPHALMLGWIAFLFGVLIALQFVTLEKVRMAQKSPGRGHPSLGSFIAFLRGEVNLGPVDLALVLTLVLVFCAIIFLELRSRRLTLLLRHIVRSPRATCVALLVACAVAVRFYLTPGQMWVADASAHVGYAWIAGRIIGAGEIPLWTNYLASGSPFLQFYGFLFFVVAGAIDAVLQNVTLSVKLVMFTAHVVSGLGAYLFVAALSRSRAAGVTAGLAYVLCFWHTQQVVVMGRYPLSLFYALLPFPFYFLERLRHPRRVPGSTIAGAVSLAALAFTHPGYGFWAFAFFALYAVLRIAARSRSSAPVPWKAALVIFLGAIVISSALTLPMWMEREHTRLNEGFDLSRDPDPTWQHLLVWSNWTTRLVPFSPGPGHWYGGYLGLSLVVLALIALSDLRQRRTAARVIPAAGCLALCALIIGGYRWPIIRDVAVVHALGSGRYLLFASFFLSVLAGLAVPSGIMRLLVGRRAIAAAVLLIAADLGPATLRAPFHSSRGSWPVRTPGDYSTLSDLGVAYGDRLPEYRALHLSMGGHTLTYVSWLLQRARMPQPHGVYDESPRSEAAIVRPLDRMVSEVLLEEFRRGELPGGSFTLDALAMLNVRFVVGPVPETDHTARVEAWSLKHFGPVIVSGKIRQWPALFDAEQSQQALYDMIQAMELDREAGRSGMIPVLASSEDLGTTPVWALLDHSVRNQRAEIRLRTSDACFARLAYSWYPYLQVIVDGEEVETYQTAGGFITVKLDAGEHRIVLRPVFSPLRRALFAGNALLLLSAMGFWLRRRKAANAA